MSIPVAAGAAILGGAASVFVPRVAHRLAVPAGSPPRTACSACARPFPAGLPGWVRPGARCPCARRPWLTVLAGALAAGLLGWAAGPSVIPAAVLGVLLAQIDVQCLRLPDPVVGALAVVVGLPPAVGSVAGLAIDSSAGSPAGSSAWSAVGSSAGLVGGSSAGLAVAVPAAVTVGSVYLVVAVVSGGGLGLGDVKLAAVLALGLGFHGWPAVLLGAVVPHLLMGPAAVVLLLGRRVRRRGNLPFGPALLTGALVAVVATSS